MSGQAEVHAGDVAKRIPVEVSLGGDSELVGHVVVRPGEGAHEIVRSLAVVLREVADHIDETLDKVAAMGDRFDGVLADEIINSEVGSGD